MEILYLWIKDYKIFKNTGFNFSDKYFFDIEYKEKESFLIKVKENPDYVQNFFENTNISNITALVGKNGSGKTTLFDFIKEHFVEGMKDEILTSNRRFVVITKSIRQDTKEVIFYVLNNLNGKIEFDKDNDINFGATDIDIQVLAYNADFKNISYIFYSNIFDLKREPEGTHGIFNISTNYLVKEDKNLSILNPNPEISEIDTHTICEILRNIEFIFSYKGVELPFKLPKMLSIKPNKFDEQYLLKEKDQNWGNTEKLDELFKSIKRIRENQENDNSKLVFVNSLLESIFFNFIRTYELGGNYNILLDVFFDIEKRQKLEDLKPLLAPTLGTPIKLNNNIYYNFFLELTKSSSRYNDFKIRSTKIILFIEEILFYIYITTTIVIENVIYINLEDDRLNISKFLNQYFQSLLISSYLEFNWIVKEDNILKLRNLSSGEQSLLTLYSRFYNAKINIGRENSDLKEDIIILIDEGDLYFHPEWQRNYFNNLLELFKFIFSKHNLQILFATNSPFLVSELPKANVIFFEKDEDGNAVVVPAKNRHEPTFASNIHTLYSDAFFMDNVMGEFARMKINKIIDKLNSENIKNINDDEKATLRKTINLIGEKLIRDSLLQKLDILTNPDYKDYNFFQRPKKSKL